MKLSQRLELVASFVAEESSLADIGTDHGYIPIELVRRGIITSAIAMDVRSGPLLRAESHIKEYHLENRIETRLSDGAAMLKPGEADAVVVAGMGGELMIHILEGGRHLWNSVRQWVLSPQSELDKVRKYLKEHGFSIDREAMTLEDGKYYTVINVVRGEMGAMNPADYLYGKCLIQEKNPVLAAFLQRERNQTETIISQLEKNDSQTAAKRRKELLEQLEWIKEALDEM